MKHLPSSLDLPLVWNTRVVLLAGFAIGNKLAKIKKKEKRREKKITGFFFNIFVEDNNAVDQIAYL